MAYSSVPVYLDPRDWQQQVPNVQRPGDQPLPLPTFPLPPHNAQPRLEDADSSLCAGQVRSNSMAERARLAKIPLPEAPLTCPRCESTNTKFCYYNNYSLTQPRHFCKTCRRYWTRGGALRNVPVGGGCRKNRRSKSNHGGNTNSHRSKSTVLMQDQQANLGSSTMGNSSSAYINPDQRGHTICQTQPLGTHLPLLPPLQNLSDQYSQRNVDLSFGAMDHQHICRTSTSNIGMVDHWRALQQFPFLVSDNGFAQSSAGFYPLDGCDAGLHDDRLRSKSSLNTLPPTSSASNLANEVKLEENMRRVSNMPRNLLGNLSVAGNNQMQYWGGSGSFSTQVQYPEDFVSSNQAGHVS